jgi:hypothetical protein
MILGSYLLWDIQQLFKALVLWVGYATVGFSIKWLDRFLFFLENSQI